MRWINLFRPEDPRRIQAFRTSIDELIWDQEHVIESLSNLFRAVDELAEAEVSYYYRRRGTRAWISGLSRFGAWVFGSIGLLLPLLAATATPDFKTAAQYGYVFLAAAASCLGANSLFGGTKGHIRFVSTQLELEKLITSARISWCKYLASQSSEDKDITSGFSLIMTYATDLHTTTISETGRWGETVLKELAKYQKQFDSKKFGASK